MSLQVECTVVALFTERPSISSTFLNGLLQMPVPAPTVTGIYAGVTEFALRRSGKVCFSFSVISPLRTVLCLVIDASRSPHWAGHLSLSSSSQTNLKYNVLRRLMLVSVFFHVSLDECWFKDKSRCLTPAFTFLFTSSLRMSNVLRDVVLAKIRLFTSSICHSLFYRIRWCQGSILGSKTY